MLIELRIHNVAVIDSVTLPLANGLNVLTGETGAGKSLIVGALGLLLGERATADRVRGGEEKASVEGVFDLQRDTVTSTGIQEALDARGIDAVDDCLILKREIAANGRSRAWINGSPVTATVLAEIGGLLVSVHGQHDSRQLVEPDHQRAVLDAFAEADDARRRVAECHASCAALATRARVLQDHRADAARRADYLRFMCREIEDAQPVDGEEETLDVEIRRLSHAGELCETAAEASAAITGNEHAALARLGSVRRALSALARIDPTTDKWQEIFDTSVYALDELARELDEYAQSIEADPEALRTLEARRERLHDLMRKHGPTLPDVIAAGAKAKAELELVDHGSLELQDVLKALADAKVALHDAATELTRLRTAAAHQLATSVSALLPELGMPDGRFSVTLNSLDAIGAAGAETVTYFATLNAGSDEKPLSRIASGGELSRIMLALSTVLARLQQVPTLVFDEVDAGIGGEVAWQVGALMQRVAGHHQVLAISHLAQIAARAHHHIVVRKSAVGTVTTADTETISGEARVLEVARMLGGDAEREISRAHARELLERGVRDSAEAPLPSTSPSPSRSPSRRTTQRRG